MDDLAVPQHHRSGAHRARRHPLLVALVTVGAVAVASTVLLWALLSSDVLGVGDDLLEAGGAPTAAPVPTAAEPSGDPSAVPGAAPGTAPDASGTGTVDGVEGGEPSEPPSPAAAPDRTLPLEVLNSTSTSGLAAAAAEALAEAGWETGAIGNYDGEEMPTTVLYPEDGGSGEDGGDEGVADGVAAATAAAVAADLGVGAATASADVDGLTVVLGPDYEP